MTVEHLLESIQSASGREEVVLIRTLAKAGGKATVRQLAKALALHEADLIADELRLQRFLQALRRRGLVSSDGETAALTVTLRHKDKMRVREACDRVFKARLASVPVAHGPGAADSDCPFCSKDFGSRKVEESGTVFAVADGSPVTRGHTLVIPVRHVENFFEMSELEHTHANALLCRLRDRLVLDDASIVGFNVGTNCGEAAGQTVMHAHVHLIPRRLGDTPVRSGVRQVVPHRHETPHLDAT